MPRLALVASAWGSRWYLCWSRPQMIFFAPLVFRGMASRHKGVSLDKTTEKAKWKEEQLRKTEARLRRKRVLNTRLDGSKKTYDKQPPPIPKLERSYNSYTIAPLELQEEKVEKRKEAEMKEQMKEMWEAYLENLLLGASAEREAALARDGRLNLRLPESEMEMRGIAVCNLRFDRTWGAVSVGKTVQVKLRKRQGRLPVGGWKRGMLVSLHRRGETNSKERQGILVDMDMEQAVISLDNLDSWVLDCLKRGGATGEKVVITKRSEDEIYNRDITQLKTLLDARNISLSPESPLGFTVGALLGLPEKLKVKNTLGEPPPPVTVYSEFVKSDSSKMAMLGKAAACPPLLVVHGPPGTGKTTALASAVLHSVSKGERVLVVAPSHAACDAFTLALANQWPGQPAGRLVRLGNKLRLTTELVEKFLPEEAKKEEQQHKIGNPFISTYEQRLAVLREELLEGGRGIHELQKEEADLVAKAIKDSMMVEDEAVCKASVVVCTLASASRNWLLRQVKSGQFPLVCVDEAGFTLDPPLLPILAAAHRLILAGDHLQLPPVVLSKEGRERGLATSLLERLALARPASVALLSTQYRSHPMISGWSSGYFYKGELEAAPQLQNRLLGGLVRGMKDGRWARSPLIFIDTEGHGEGESGGAGGQSISNLGEALVAVEVVETLIAAGVTEDMVGMISPYWAQAGLLRSLMWEGAGRLGVEVRTVDGYQGREKEVVVVSLVRSNPQGAVGFLEESRRLNVAVTRARRCAIIIGDAASLATDPAIASLVDFCLENACLRKLSEVFPS